MSEWANKHRVLDPMFSAEAGPWDSARVPHAIEWMDSSNAPWVRRVSIMASTQVSKTETGNNVVGYHVHQFPSPTMLVLPREADAKLVLQRRILPMVRASKALRREMRTGRSDATEREITFRRSVVYVRAAQSPADLASVPVRVVIGDECDKWPGWSGREASPWDLVLERTRTFPDHIAYLLSTPTTRAGLINKEFEAGDRRRFHVPCPHCSRFHVYTWSRVKWSKDVRTVDEFRRNRDAWYECQHCEGRITERQRRASLSRGVWVPDGWTVDEWVAEGRAKDRAEHRSYHLWAAYSPWATWSDIVAKFLQSKDDPAKLQNFVNSWLAELWEERIETTSDEAVAACIEPRPSGECPPQVRAVTAAIDVQKDYIYATVSGWGLDEESFVLVAQRCETLDEAGELVFGSPWGEQQLHVRACLVDSRHRRDEVMEFCRLHAPSARMIAGVERDAPVPFSTVKIDRHPRTGVPLAHSMTVWTVNVGMFKDLVAHRMALASLPPAEDRTMAGRIHLPNDIEPDDLKHLSSEHKVLERKGRKERHRWVLKPGHQRNELWDCLVYNAAAARLCRIDLLRSPTRQPRGASNTPANEQPKVAPSTPPLPLPQRPGRKGPPRFPLL